MQLGDEHGQGRALVEQPLSEGGGLGSGACADGVEEGPGRAGDGLAHEGIDILRADGATGTIERQLLQLGLQQAHVERIALEVPRNEPLRIDHDGNRHESDCDDSYDKRL